MNHRIPLLAAALLSFLWSGCAERPVTKPFFNRFSILGIGAPKPLPEPPRERGDFWEDTAVDGAPMIVVKLAQQRAYFYRGRHLVGATKVSTGKDGFDTPPGAYRVQQKSRNHVSSLYGEYVDAAGAVVQRNVDTSKHPRPPGATYRGAKMPYFLRFSGGYGLHAGHVPNYPASHGCIRLPNRMAERFFNASSVGTVVVIER